MMSLTFGLFTQVSESVPHGPLVSSAMPYQHIYGVADLSMPFSSHQFSGEICGINYSDPSLAPLLSVDIKPSIGKNSLLTH